MKKEMILWRRMKNNRAKKKNKKNVIIRWFVSQASRSVDVRWQERGPRSLPGDYDSNSVDSFNDSVLVKKNFETDKSTLRTTNAVSESETVSNLHSTNITLDDVFISVKTTRNYHKWRLPVVLKTWFQLAKNQVIITTNYVFYRRRWKWFSN